MAKKTIEIILTPDNARNLHDLLDANVESLNYLLGAFGHDLTSQGYNAARELINWNKRSKKSVLEALIEKS